jgi:hypothetical protein
LFMKTRIVGMLGLLRYNYLFTAICTLAKVMQQNPMYLIVQSFTRSRSETQTLLKSATPSTSYVYLEFSLRL